MCTQNIMEAQALRLNPRVLDLYPLPEDLELEFEPMIEPYCFDDANDLHIKTFRDEDLNFHKILTYTFTSEKGET